jgi:hypothetical protein
MKTAKRVTTGADAKTETKGHNEEKGKSIKQP